MRKIVVDNKLFYWKHGRQNIAIYNEERKRVKVVYASTLLGIHPDTAERAKWKRTNEANVTPAHVAQYIRDNLLKEVS